MEEKRNNTEIQVQLNDAPDVSETPENPIVEEYNASFEPDAEPVLSAEELQDTLLEDSGMNSFQKFIAKLDDKKWNLYQRVLGVLLGAAACIALFWKGSADNESAFSWSLIVAIVIAIWAPNILEKQGLRKIPKTRSTMAITMGVIIVVYFAVIGIRSGFNFRG